ncbi:MAG: hypothetical protein ACI3VN_06500, partial [Candidatus Onthomonas sp.]
MEEKKRQGRRSYLNDFQQNAAGEYLYTGAHYTFVEQGKNRRRFLTELWLLCGVALAAAVAGGCIPGSGMDQCFYVMLPYAAGLVGAISLCWGLGRLTAGGDPLRAYVYEQTVEKLPGRAMVTAVMAGLTLLGSLVRLILSGFSGKVWGSLLFFALE